MRVLVTGAGGMLGHDVVARGARARRRGDRARARRLDLTDEAARSRRVADARVDAVINCAAWTDVDGAEARRGRRAAVNGDGAGNVAARRGRVGARVVHVSTDYVFDGARRPRRASSPTRPARSAHTARRSSPAGASPRPAGRVRSCGPPGCSAWAAPTSSRRCSLGAVRDELTVVDRRDRLPTGTGHLAPALVELARDEGATGAFHVGGAGRCSWHDLRGGDVRPRRGRLSRTPVPRRRSWAARAAAGLERAGRRARRRTPAPAVAGGPAGPSRRAGGLMRLRDRRRRLHRHQLRPPDPRRASRRPGHRARRADVRRRQREPRRRSRIVFTLRRGRHRRRGHRRRLAGQASPSCTSRPSRTTTTRCRPVAVPADQRDRHLPAARGRPPARHPATTTSRPTRSTATSSWTTRRSSPRRPPTTRRARTRRPRRRPTCSCAPGPAASACAADDLQLLEQLRAVPARREVHPAPDHERDRRRAPQALRLGETCATGSTSRTTTAPSGRDLERGAGRDVH